MSSHQSDKDLNFVLFFRSSRSRSRSRSRSSTPEGIPRRNNPADRSDSPVNRNTAPLQKRLMNLASSSTGIIKNIKKEPEDKNKKSSTSGGNNTTGSKELSAAGEHNFLRFYAENSSVEVSSQYGFIRNGVIFSKHCLVFQFLPFFLLKLL